jgi:hypothetical protein
VIFALDGFHQGCFNSDLAVAILIFMFAENEIVLEMLVEVRECDCLFELHCIEGVVA